MFMLLFLNGILYTIQEYFYFVKLKKGGCNTSHVFYLGICLEEVTDIYFVTIGTCRPKSNGSGRTIICN